ncbi:(2Fe-2S)-binding protein [Streptomyces sp. NPDC088745]|uniref:(2Fe-2S)-binding protein n=1 Tax=Streptomyces sp. NPDC088745 TaxID=3365884 RepID=UPI0037F5C39B
MDFAELGSVNGFFALRTGEPGSGHVPLSRVYAGDTGDAAPLARRVDKVAARLDAPERRVAASIAHLGIVARLWSVALGSAALYDEVPDLSADRLHWDADGQSPDDLLLTDVRALPATADTLRDGVQYGHLLPLAEALRRDGNISPQLLWGNAGSALAAAVTQLRRWAREKERPEVARRAAVIAHELFAHPDLNSTGSLRAGAFRRNSCCLYYRCPAGGLCGDCVFDRAPRRSSPQPGSE